MNTPRDLAIPLSRITWRDGQSLTSRDLRDDQLHLQRLRHLHVRYQHRTWGVVEGLDVLRVINFAFVTAGYALDSEGRELLLPSDTRFPGPVNVPNNTTVYLVLSYGSQGGGCATTPDLATLCPGVSNPMPLEQGVLSWKTVTEVRPGNDVLLARVLFGNGRLTGQADTSIQRHATSLAQPVVWADTTLGGQTGWTDGSSTGLPEITANIDTSDGGFTSTPAYFARLSGTSQITTGFISSAGPTGFTFVVRCYAAMTGGTTVNAATAESDGWTVSWVAVELGG